MHSSVASTNRLFFRNPANSFDRASLGLDGSENFTLTTLNAYFLPTILGFQVTGLSSASNVPIFKITNSGAQTIMEARSDNKIAFYGGVPTAQATTGVAAAVFAANTSGIVDDSATFDGYTIGQVVTGLRAIGILQ